MAIRIQSKPHSSGGQTNVCLFIVNSKIFQENKPCKYFFSSKL